MCLYGSAAVGYDSSNESHHFSPLSGERYLRHGPVSGGVLRKMVAEQGEVEMDFSGIEMMTQSAADEFIGRIVRHDNALLDLVRFQHCAPAVKEMIQWAADNADSVPHRQDAFAGA